MAGTGIARYALKTGTLTFNSVTYDTATIPPMKAQEQPAVDVTATSDTKTRKIKGALTTDKPFTISVYMKGASDIVVGATGALTITPVLENGVADVTAAFSYNNVIVTDVQPASLDAQGDRKAVYDVTFDPDGSEAAQ